MTAPRIEIDLRKIRQNARFLVDRLATHGIDVTGVTKAVCGDPAVTAAMLDGGVAGLADARVANVKRMREAGITCPISMIRAPMQSEIEQVIRFCETSYNTEIETISRLAAVSQRRGLVHKVVLMVEMGDMRDGIMPDDLGRIAALVTDMPGVALKGIGANFTCLGCVAPDAASMSMFSTLANEVEGACGPFLETVSGGGSANLAWALGPGTRGRINEVRLGEAILLGTDPVSGKPIEGLHTDAFTLVAEVIETKFKTRPHPLHLVGPTLGALRLVKDIPCNSRAIIAIGFQDTDVRGLAFPAGVTFIGGTSDHTVLETTGSKFPAGAEMKMRLSYSALMRAMNAPDVTKTLCREKNLKGDIGDRSGRPHSALV